MAYASILPATVTSVSRLSWNGRGRERRGVQASSKGVVAVRAGKAGQSESGGGGEVGAAAIAAIGGGLVANPIVAWSLFTLKTTGCGLPPGPGGSLGALEGVSYLALLSIISWSAFTKIKTGSGLPNGPFGLLGAVEGLSYLSLLAIALVFGLQFLDYGYIPGPVPSQQCFG